MKFLDHALVLARAVAGLLVGVEGPVKNVVHGARFGAAQAPALNGREQRRKQLHILRGHLHIAAGKEGVQFRAALLAPAVLGYGVDELIDSRRLGEAGYLVAEALGFLF